MKAKSAKVTKARKTRAPAQARLGQKGKQPVKASGIPRRWTWHYRTLLALRERLQQAAQLKRREATAAIEPHSMHVADSATDEFDHDLLLGLLGRETSALTEIDDALTRLSEGRYGVCEETGAPIPAARLRAIPWCRFSREAEERFERQGTVAKFRLPGPGSVGAVKPTLPGTGTVPPETLMEGEELEAAENEASTEMVESAAPEEPEEPESRPPRAR